MKKTFLAIVPARGGSKSIPRKNLVLLNGKPLIYWTLCEAEKSQYITDVVVSSEDDEILNTTKDYGFDIVKRPDFLAKDDTRTEPVLLDVLEHLQKKGKTYDFLVLLQPTSPLRKAEDIDNAIEILLEKNATSLISVYVPEHSPYKAFKQNKDGYLEGIVDNETPFMPRQSLPQTYYPNGAIYIVDTSYFLKSKKLFSQKTIPYVMSKEKSIDIDTISDLENAEGLLKK